MGDAVDYTVERLEAEPLQRWRTSRAAPALDLPAGRYRIESRLGQANARVVRELRVTAGAGQQVLLEHDAGRIRLKLAETLGGLAPADVFWEIRNGDGALVWSSAKSEPQLWLQAGSYKVQVTHRDRRVTRALVVKGGEAQAMELRQIGRAHV